MAQLKGKGTVYTASSGQKSAFVMWRTIEIESTIPRVGGWERGTGWWWVEGRKQRSFGASREGRAEEVCVVRTGAPLQRGFQAPWGEGCRGPITKTTKRGHQLTMGSTSASRSNSSWISSVLPESLLATELGDGEFLEGTREWGWGWSEGSLRTPEGIQGAERAQQPLTPVRSNLCFL